MSNEDSCEDGGKGGDVGAGEDDGGAESVGKDGDEAGSEGCL